MHVFDYPFEESDALVSSAFRDFGEVKKVKDQLSIADPEIFTGTRLVSMVLKTNSPRSLLIGGYLCWVWYKGQPLICNLCSVQAHMSANCQTRTIASFVVSLIILLGSAVMLGVTVHRLWLLLLMWCLLLSLRILLPLRLLPSFY